MPSSLNADNGVVSGTAGLKSSADNSGVLDLQTNGTTAISISASQVVTFANQPAYTGGTANGVLYLNASKVLTSGSALTFDGSQLDIPLGSAGTPSLSTPTDPNTGMFFPAADTIAFAEGGVEAMRLDASGNLGLGVTPSAWSGLTAFELSAAGSQNFAMYSGGVLRNAFYNGTNFIYKASAASTLYEQAAGAHRWYTAPSGTAGNAITFTQAMTLDASGNLLVGATSGTGARLHIGRLNADQNQPVLTWSDAQDNTGYLSIRSASEAGENGAAISADTALFFGRIISGTFTERARIDSSGNFRIGTTADAFGSNERFSVAASGTGSMGMGFSGTRNILVGIWNTTTGSSELIRFAAGSGGSTVGTITTNGSSTTAYNTSSDYRLKNTVTPMTGALAKVAQLKPVTYKWNADGSDGEGFIAHELAEVCPNAVTGAKDAVETYTDDEGNEQTRPKYQGIDTSFLVATLTAALQEAHGLIKNLETRISALEAK